LSDESGEARHLLRTGSLAEVEIACAWTVSNLQVIYAMIIASSVSIMAKQNDVIRRLRTNQGMSQVELARRTGISRQALGAIEAGIYQPSVAVALSLALELGETVENLFGKSSEPKSSEINAAWPKGNVLSKDRRLRRAALGRVGGRVVAVPQQTSCLALLPAAGTVDRMVRSRAAVSTYHTREEIDSTLLIAGCDPAVTILIE
jgi:DNA-binding XRE family transcriptional regulator